MRRGVIHEFRTQLAFALGMQQGDFDRAGSQERTIQREDLFRVWETASISVGTRLGSSYPMVYPVETGPATLGLLLVNEVFWSTFPYDDNEDLAAQFKNMVPV